MAHVYHPGMSRGRRRTGQSACRPRLVPRLPQRLRDLDRAPGAQHRRLGQHQRPPAAERDDPLGAQRLPGRPALRKRRRRKGTRRNPPRRHQGPGRAGGRRAAPGGRAAAPKRCWKPRPRRGSGKTPTGPRTNSCSPCSKTRKKRSKPKTAKSSLNLGSLLTNLAQQIGIGESLAEKLPPDAGQIEILKSDQLKTAQNIAVAIKGLALVLSILTFAAFGAAIYLSRDGRWVTVLLSGIGLIAAGFAVIVVRHIAGGIVVDQLVTTTASSRRAKRPGRSAPR